MPVPEYEVQEVQQSQDSGKDRRNGSMIGPLGMLSTIIVTDQMDRPRSALSSLLLRATTSSSNRRSSTGSGGPITAQGGTGILDLLRRPSAGSSAERGTEELPESLLEGLSAEEREHIRRVVAESRRSPTTEVAAVMIRWVQSGWVLTEHSY